jgi:DNA-binding NarL/FixJ family response regulator
LLVDDQLLVRAGMRALLTGMAGVGVVAETAEAEAAVRLALTHRPQVALVHLSTLGLRGLDLVSRLARDVPDCRVVVYSMSGRGQEVLEALRAGAAGYLLTLARPEELESALGAVLRGETYLGPRIAHHVAEAARDRATSADGVERLTTRQREVLRFIAEGLGTKEIADRLKIGVRTVETHRANLRERLDLHDIAGLVRFAIVHGLVKPG